MTMRTRALTSLAIVAVLILALFLQQGNSKREAPAASVPEAVGSMGSEHPAVETGLRHPDGCAQRSFPASTPVGVDPGADSGSRVDTTRVIPVGGLSAVDGPQASGVARTPQIGRSTVMPEDLDAIAQALPPPHHQSYLEFRRDNPQADPTDQSTLHRAILAARELYGQHLKPDERQRHGAWVERLETMSAALIPLVAVHRGIPLIRQDPDGRSRHLVGFEAGVPVWMTTTNANAAISTNANRVRENLDFDPSVGVITGAGLIVQVHEAGLIPDHIEFMTSGPNPVSRIIGRYGTQYNAEHAAHVAGTIGATGINPAAKGMAPEVLFRSYYNLYGSHILNGGMHTSGQPDRSVVGNASLSWGAIGPRPADGHGHTEEPYYDNSSSSMDSALYDTPFYLQFFSAGNSLNTMAGMNNISKNGLDIANALDLERDAQGRVVAPVGLESSSSRGPTFGGRIKPDLTANGSGLLSTYPNDNYASRTGTSMSSPNAAGSAVVLIDYYRKRFPGQYLRSSTLKALLINTADDMGVSGPDYNFGWGYVNVLAAGSIVKRQADQPSSGVIVESNLAQGTVSTRSYTCDGANPIRVTLAWLDPAPASSVRLPITTRTGALVNDLDLRLIGPDGSVYRPFVMPFVVGSDFYPPFDRGSLNTDWGGIYCKAVPGDNTTDNVEQVLISAPMQGNYTLTVSHKGSLRYGNQDYSLAVTGLSQGGNNIAAPAIITQPANLSVTVGQTATFTVAASGTPVPTFQWSRSNDGGGTWTAIVGARAATYTTPATVIGDHNAQFRVVVSNSAGSATSKAAVLTVTVPTVAPAIGTQPANASVTVGQTATFTAAASGTPAPTFQWSRSNDAGKTWTAISGATAATYTTAAMVIGDNNAQFRVVASNSAGNATSNAAVLTVTIPTVAPAISTQPANASVTVGQTATFTAAASGTPAPTFQWSRSNDGGKTWTAISGATAATYTTAAMVIGDNNAQFRVVASNSAGNATSNAAVLTVTVPTVAPAISTQPANASVTVGQTATFTAAASGTPAPTFQWSRSNDAGKTWTAISGATAATYTTAAMVIGDNNAQFRVVASNSAGNATSNAAVLTVTVPTVAPAISTQPANASVTVGQTATFTAAASGTPAPTFQWSRSNDDGGTWTAIAGATAATYITPATVIGDHNARFRVVASNSAGSATSNVAVLTATIPTVAPAISTQPANASVTVGQTATFTAAASGTPAPTFQWSRSNDAGKTWTAISGATAATYITAATVIGDHNARFRVVASNRAGSVVSDDAVLAVTSPGEIPAITSHPANYEVTVGKPAMFSCSATSASAMTFQWQRSNDAGKTWTTISGATASSFTTNAASIMDNGALFRVVVSNSIGITMTNAATLTVKPTGTAPAMTSMPEDQAVTLGKTATFSVKATGDPIPGITWQRSDDGGVSWADIRGATGPVYGTSPTEAKDHGAKFRAIASNDVGRALSNPATLSVSAATSSAEEGNAFGAGGAGGCGLGGGLAMLGMALFLAVLGRCRNG